MMKISLKPANIEKQSSLLLFGLFEDEELSPSLKAMDKALGGYITKLIKQGMIKTTVGTLFPLVHPDVEKCPILIVGCGKKAEWQVNKLHDAALNAFKHLHVSNHNKLVCYLTELTSDKLSLAQLIRC